MYSSRFSDLSILPNLQIDKEIFDYFNNLIFRLVKPIRAGVNPSTNTSTPIPTIRGGGQSMD
ncbi:unnamed protein product, partial [Rotaria socialis]